MPFQHIVNRAYTTGFVGEFVRTGPRRVNVGRLIANAAGAPNRIGRAVGYAGDLSTVGSTNSHTLAADVHALQTGGLPFVGLMIHPKHYALSGVAGNALAPSLDLPNGSEVEVAYMCNGLVVELVNYGTEILNVTVGDGLAYVSSATTAAQNPMGLELGTIVPFDQNGGIPAGFTEIPNARVTTPVTLQASAVGAVIGAVTTVDLTQ